MEEKKQRLGELLVEYGLITTNQLKEALRRQAQVGGQIGSILIEMGFITTDDLLNFLSKQLGVPSANLLKLEIDPEVLKLLPMDKIKTMKVLPIGVDEAGVTLAMVNPNDLITLNEVEFTLGRKVQPVVVPSAQMEAAIKSLSSGKTGFELTEEIEKTLQQKRREKPPSILALLKYLAKSEATDMLLTAGVPPSIKLHSELKRIHTENLSPANCEQYAREMMTDRGWQIFLKRGDYDFAVTYPDIGRFRVNVYRQRNSVSITIRHVKDIVPTLSELNLPEWLEEYAFKKQGLVLIAGPTGHGKTTTLSCLIDIINTRRRCNIVTLEDPVEYLHKHKNSNVNQREIGIDCESFAEGLKHVFRQDPDVIVIGELRDPESFEIALHAADTGHLVMATVHASSTTATIERIIDMFPTTKETLIRAKMADSLLIVFAQKLIPLKDGQGRIPAFEKLINTYRIKSFIREGKTHQIRTQMQSGTEDFYSFDLCLAELYKKGRISYNDALMFAENQDYLKEL
ncbi:MAG: PilT/PilU family type 4a pilus ATPase, partial [Nitrospirae bacterium]